MGWNPLWAWVFSVLDPQDSINELLNCVSELFGLLTYRWRLSFSACTDVADGQLKTGAKIHKNEKDFTSFSKTGRNSSYFRFTEVRRSL